MPETPDFQTDLMRFFERDFEATEPSADEVQRNAARARAAKLIIDSYMTRDRGFWEGLGSHFKGRWGDIKRGAAMDYRWARENEEARESIIREKLGEGFAGDVASATGKLGMRMSTPLFLAAEALGGTHIDAGIDYFRRRRLLDTLRRGEEPDEKDVLDEKVAILESYRLHGDPRVPESERKPANWREMAGRNTGAMTDFILEMLLSRGLLRATVGSLGTAQGAAGFATQAQKVAGFRKLLQADPLVDKLSFGTGLKSAAARALPMTGFMPQRVLGTAFRYREPKFGLTKEDDDAFGLELLSTGDSWGKALAKGFVDTYVEVFSEQVGEVLGGPIRKGAEKLAGRLGFEAALTRFWHKQAPARNNWPRFRRMLRSGGWSSMWEEMLEERVGDLMRAPLAHLPEPLKMDLGSSFLPSPRDLAIEALSFGFPGAMASVYNIGTNRAGSEERMEAAAKARDAIKFRGKFATRDEVREKISPLVDAFREEEESTLFFHKLPLIRNLAGTRRGGMKDVLDRAQYVGAHEKYKHAKREGVDPVDAVGKYFVNANGLVLVETPEQRDKLNAGVEGKEAFIVGRGTSVLQSGGGSALAFVHRKFADKEEYRALLETGALGVAVRAGEESDLDTDLPDEALKEPNAGRGLFNGLEHSEADRTQHRILRLLEAGLLPKGALKYSPGVVIVGSRAEFDAEKMPIPASEPILMMDEDGKTPLYGLRLHASVAGSSFRLTPYSQDRSVVEEVVHSIFGEPDRPHVLVDDALAYDSEAVGKARAALDETPPRRVGRIARLRRYIGTRSHERVAKFALLSLLGWGKGASVSEQEFAHDYAESPERARALARHILKRAGEAGVKALAATEDDFKTFMQFAASDPAQTPMSEATRREAERVSAEQAKALADEEAERRQVEDEARAFHEAEAKAEEPAAAAPARDKAAVEPRPPEKAPAKKEPVEPKAAEPVAIEDDEAAAAPPDLRKPTDAQRDAAKTVEHVVRPEAAKPLLPEPTDDTAGPAATLFSTSSILDVADYDASLSRLYDEAARSLSASLMIVDAILSNKPIPEAAFPNVPPRYARDWPRPERASRRITAARRKSVFREVVRWNASRMESPELRRVFLEASGALERSNLSADLAGVLGEVARIDHETKKRVFEASLLLLLEAARSRSFVDSASLASDADVTVPAGEFESAVSSLVRDPPELRPDGTTKPHVFRFDLPGVLVVLEWNTKLPGGWSIRLRAPFFRIASLVLDENGKPVRDSKLKAPPLAADILRTYVALIRNNQTAIVEAVEKYVDRSLGRIDASLFTASRGTLPAVSGKQMRELSMPVLDSILAKDIEEYVLPDDLTKRLADWRKAATFPEGSMPHSVFILHFKEAAVPVTLRWSGVSVMGTKEDPSARRLVGHWSVAWQDPGSDIPQAEQQIPGAESIDVLPVKAEIDAAIAAMWALPGVKDRLFTILNDRSRRAWRRFDAFGKEIDPEEEKEEIVYADSMSETESWDSKHVMENLFYGTGLTPGSRIFWRDKGGAEHELNFEDIADGQPKTFFWFLAAPFVFGQVIRGEIRSARRNWTKEDRLRHLGERDGADTGFTRQYWLEGCLEAAEAAIREAAARLPLYEAKRDALIAKIEALRRRGAKQSTTRPESELLARLKTQLADVEKRLKEAAGKYDRPSSKANASIGRIRAKLRVNTRKMRALESVAQRSPSQEKQFAGLRKTETKLKAALDAELAKVTAGRQAFQMRQYGRLSEKQAALAAEIEAIESGDPRVLKRKLSPGEELDRLEKQLQIVRNVLRGLTGKSGLLKTSAEEIASLLYVITCTGGKAIRGWGETQRVVFNLGGTYPEVRYAGVVSYRQPFRSRSVIPLDSLGRPTTAAEAHQAVIEREDRQSQDVREMGSSLEPRGEKPPEGEEGAEAGADTEALVEQGGSSVEMPAEAPESASPISLDTAEDLQQIWDWLHTPAGQSALRGLSVGERRLLVANAYRVYKDRKHQTFLRGAARLGEMVLEIEDEWSAPRDFADTPPLTSQVPLLAQMVRISLFGQDGMEALAEVLRAARRGGLGGAAIDTRECLLDMSDKDIERANVFGRHLTRARRAAMLRDPDALLVFVDSWEEEGQIKSTLLTEINAGLPFLSAVEWARTGHWPEAKAKKLFEDRKRKVSREEILAIETERLRKETGDPDAELSPAERLTITNQYVEETAVVYDYAELFAQISDDFADMDYSADMQRSAFRAVKIVDLSKLTPETRLEIADDIRSFLVRNRVRRLSVLGWGQVGTQPGEKLRTLGAETMTLALSMGEADSEMLRAFRGVRSRDARQDNVATLEESYKALREELTLWEQIDATTYEPAMERWINEQRAALQVYAPVRSLYEKLAIASDKSASASDRAKVFQLQARLNEIRLAALTEASESKTPVAVSPLGIRAEYLVRTGSFPAEVFRVVCDEVGTVLDVERLTHEGDRLDLRLLKRDRSTLSALRFKERFPTYEAIDAAFSLGEREATIVFAGCTFASQVPPDCKLHVVEYQGRAKGFVSVNGVIVWTNARPGSDVASVIFPEQLRELLGVAGAKVYDLDISGKSVAVDPELLRQMDRMLPEGVTRIEQDDAMEEENRPPFRLSELRFAPATAVEMDLLNIVGSMVENPAAKWRRVGPPVMVETAEGAKEQRPYIDPEVPDFLRVGGVLPVRNGTLPLTPLSEFQTEADEEEERAGILEKTRAFGLSHLKHGTEWINLPDEDLQNEALRQTIEGSDAVVYFGPRESARREAAEAIASRYGLPFKMAGSKSATLRQWLSRREAEVVAVVADEDPNHDVLGSAVSALDIEPPSADEMEKRWVEHLEDKLNKMSSSERTLEEKLMRLTSVTPLSDAGFAGELALYRDTILSELGKMGSVSPDEKVVIEGLLAKLGSVSRAVRQVGLSSLMGLLGRLSVDEQRRLGDAGHALTLKAERLVQVSAGGTGLDRFEHDPSTPGGFVYRVMDGLAQTALYLDDTVFSGSPGLRKAYVKASRLGRVAHSLTEGMRAQWMRGTGLSFLRLRKLPNGHAGRVARLFAAIMAHRWGMTDAPIEIESVGEMRLRAMEAHDRGLLEQAEAMENEGRAFAVGGPSVESLLNEWDLYAKANGLASSDELGQVVASVMEVVNREFDSMLEEGGPASFVETLADQLVNAFGYERGAAYSFAQRWAMQSGAQLKMPSFGVIGSNLGAGRVFDMKNPDGWSDFMTGTSALLAKTALRRTFINTASVTIGPMARPEVIAVPKADGDSILELPFLRRALENIERYLATLGDRSPGGVTPWPNPKDTVLDARDPIAALREAAETLQLRSSEYVRISSRHSGVDYYLVAKGETRRVMDFYLHNTQPREWSENGWQKTLYVFDSLFAWAKFMTIGLSLFHWFALAESLAATYGLSLDNPIFHPSKFAVAWRLAGEAERNPARAIPWIKGGMQLDTGGPDVRMDLISKQLAQAIGYLETQRKEMPAVAPMILGLKTARWIKNVVTFGLWNRVHNGFKLMSAEYLYSEAARFHAEKGLKMDEEGLRQSIAQHVNEAFGGLEWANYAWTSPGAVRFLHRAMFAPDWTFSVLNVARMTELPVLRRLLNPHHDVWQKTSIMTRYWPGMFFIVLQGLPNVLQAMIYAAFGDPDDGDKPFMWMNEKGRKTWIDVTPMLRAFGRTRKDDLGANLGMKRVFWRWGKQAYEIGEGFLADPGQYWIRKSNPTLRMAFEFLTGTSLTKMPLPFAKAPFMSSLFGVDGKFVDGRLFHLTKNFVPFWASSLATKQPSNVFASAAFGASEGRVVVRFQEALLDFANGRIGKENLWREIYSINRDAYRNGLWPDQMFESALAGSVTRLGRTFMSELNESKPGSDPSDALIAKALPLVRLGKDLDYLRRSLEEQYADMGMAMDQDRYSTGARAILMAADEWDRSFTEDGEDE